MASEVTPGADRAEEPTRCREFGLSDAMVLVAGTAFLLSIEPYLLAKLTRALVRLARALALNRSDLLEHWPVAWIAIRNDLASALFTGERMLHHLLISLVPAFLIVRWKRPRPPLRALLRQPGTVAAVAAVFGALWVNGYLHLALGPNVDNRLPACLAIGGTVTLAWAVLALGRRWQGEPGWIDRLGRALGAAAIAHMILGILEFKILPMYW